MRNILVLFDIDGTLVEAGTEVHRQSFTYTAKKVFNVYFNLDDHPYLRGTTDRNIIDFVGKLSGLNKTEIASKTEDYNRENCFYFIKNVDDDYVRKILPGVKTLVLNLLRKGVSIGLLSGNFEKKAWVKIKKLGLKKYFKFGAFGDSLKDRYELLPVAIEKGEKSTGKRFSRDKIFVVGDTCHDVECAKVNGVISIAVASGRHGIEELKDCGADYVLKDLTDTTKFLKIIGIK